MLTQVETDYLYSRGYTQEHIDAERWVSLYPGTYKFEDTLIRTEQAAIAVACRSASNKLTAIHTVCIPEKRYNKYLLEAGKYLPVMFGTPEDYGALFASHETFLVEGVFDRIALKRCMPEASVFSLLGLSASEKVLTFLKYSSAKVWIALDRDEPGLRASRYLARKLDELKIENHFVVHPFKDTAQWLQAQGVEEMTLNLRKGLELTCLDAKKTSVS